MFVHAECSAGRSPLHSIGLVFGVIVAILIDSERSRVTVLQNMERALHGRRENSNSQISNLEVGRRYIGYLHRSLDTIFSLYRTKIKG